MRRTLVASATAIAAIGAVGAAVVLGQSGDGQDTAAVLGSDTSNVEALLAAGGSRMSEEVADAMPLAEIDAESSRAILEDGANTVYLARSLEDPSRVCLIAAREAPDGVWSGATCLDEQRIGQGTAVVILQDGPGDVATPRAYYGLVPRGATRVAASWGEQATVRDGVFAIRRENAAGGSGTLSFTIDGVDTAVKLG